MSYDLNMRVWRLLQNEPFFAALSRKIEKRAMPSIPTAGVRVNPDTAQFEMVYNPDFFASLPENQVLGVLKHEYYHLIFEHVTSRKPEGVPPKMWNIAADLAINSHLQGELPENCCMPGVGPFAEYPLGMSAEWYLRKLQEDQQEQDGEGDGEGGEGSGGDAGDGNFDDHSGWDAAGQSAEQEAANQMAKERLRQGLKEAAAEASQSSQGWGTISADLRKDILARITPKVDWRKVLRYFIRTSQRASKSSSIKRINRRYAYIHPGKKVKRQAKIAIAIDQSGSVSDEMLVKFFSELNGLAKHATFTVIPFDTEVDPKLNYEWKKGDRVPAKREKFGGTCFDAPTAYVNEHGGFDGLIVLTDMEAPKPKRCKAQRMWMTDQQHAERPYFSTTERVIVID